MTEEAYVSFEVAKLLKEKGFEIDTSKDYWKIGEDGTMYFMSSIGAYTSDINNKFAFYRPADTYPCPTQQMAMRWLREGKGIAVEIKVRHNTGLGGLPLFEYQWCVYHGLEKHLDCCRFFEIYEEAAEAAIKYCMENLIKEG